MKQVFDDEPFKVTSQRRCSIDVDGVLKKIDIMDPPNPGSIYHLTVM